MLLANALKTNAQSLSVVDSLLLVNVQVKQTEGRFEAESEYSAVVDVELERFRQLRIKMLLASSYAMQSLILFYQ